MSDFYTPHFEVYVEHDTGASADRIAQISPEQTDADARAAGEDLREVYGSDAATRCVLHVCYHNADGSSARPCDTEVLWQNA